MEPPVTNYTRFLLDCKPYCAIDYLIVYKTDKLSCGGSTYNSNNLINKILSALS